MNVNIPLLSDSDNTYCDKEQIKLVETTGKIYLELQNPYRLVSVNAFELRKTINFLVGD